MRCQQSNLPLSTAHCLTARHCTTLLLLRHTHAPPAGRVWRRWMCACSATWRLLMRHRPRQSRRHAQWSGCCAAWRLAGRAVAGRQQQQTAAMMSSSRGWTPLTPLCEVHAVCSRLELSCLGLLVSVLWKAPMRCCLVAGWGVGDSFLLCLLRLKESSPMGHLTATSASTGQTVDAEVAVCTLMSVSRGGHLL